MFFCHQKLPYISDKKTPILFAIFLTTYIHSYLLVTNTFLTNKLYTLITLLPYYLITSFLITSFLITLLPHSLLPYYLIPYYLITLLLNSRSNT
jgi:hypothetical protein